MGTFFHGWRRKAGCFTLVLALVLMGGWMRSLVVWDMIFTYPTSEFELIFKSEQGLLGWEHSIDPDRIELRQWFSDEHERGFAIFAYLDNQDESRFTWRWRYGGFSCGECSLGIPFSFFVVPYWFLVLPMTLLSAYLILWKPRK